MGLPAVPVPSPEKDRERGLGTLEHQPPGLKPVLGNPQSEVPGRLPELRPLPLQAPGHGHAGDRLLPGLQQGQGRTIGACTSPISTSLGGNPWHPKIEASVTNKPVWEDTSTIQLSITADPPPPDGATAVTVRVEFNVDKADDDFEVFTSHNVSISAAGTGSLSVTNPFTRTGADFTEDRTEQAIVRITSGANSKPKRQLRINILDDDPIPITVYLPDDNPAIYAVDGPGSKPTNLNPAARRATQGGSKSGSPRRRA